MIMGLKRFICVFLLVSVVFAGVRGISVFAETETDSAAQTYSISDADVFIDVPALRQYGDYSCGTTCVQMIMNYLFPYDGDINLTVHEEQLSTDKELGTSPSSIVRFFSESGVSFSTKRDIPVGNLISYLDEEKIVMMPVQAWSAADDGSYNLDCPEKDNYLTEGHWIICVGYRKASPNDKTDETLFYFNDPACVGHCVMTAGDLDKRWVDKDNGGEVFRHYGLIIDSTGSYNPATAYYLQ